MVDELPLKILWDRWLTAVEACPLVNRVARPQLLPHLRAIDRAQQIDMPETLALSGLQTTADQVQAALASVGVRAMAAGWPAPLPSPPGAAAPQPAVSGYAEALLESRLAILQLLQGESPDEILPAELNLWRMLITGEQDTDEPARLPSSVWTAAEQQSSWVARAILLHLAVHRARPWTTGIGRAARLLMNTLVAAAGHPWLRIPGARRQEYEFAVAVALGTGDAGPFCRLLVDCADP